MKKLRIVKKTEITSEKDTDEKTNLDKSKQNGKNKRMKIKHEKVKLKTKNKKLQWVS